MCPTIIEIYKLVLKEGCKIKRVYKKHPDYDGSVFLQIWTKMGIREFILYPPGREIFRDGHGERC